MTPESDFLSVVVSTASLLLVAPLALMFGLSWLKRAAEL